MAYRGRKIDGKKSKRINLPASGYTTFNANHDHMFTIHPNGTVTIYRAVHPDNSNVHHNHQYIGKWPNGYVTENKSACYPGCKSIFGVDGAPPHVHNVTLTNDINSSVY